jgi:hypothetical protein
VTVRILKAITPGEPVAPAALQLMLRRFVHLSMSGRDDVTEPLGAALALELERQAERGCDADCEGWIVVFSQAASISDDPRLRPATTKLLEKLRPRWTTEPGKLVDETMRVLEACLAAVPVANVDNLAAEAIDALERVVAGSYQPGSGVSHQIAAQPFVRGGLSDHVWAASALMTAYALTARLPYGMLADEVIQSALRNPPGGASFAHQCRLARVMCRLAALHRDEDYRRTAVLWVNEDYAAHAARLLTGLSASIPSQGVDAALFGLALADWLDLQ